MLVIHDPSLTGSIPNPAIRLLIEQRFAEVGDLNVIVVDPGDRVSALEQESGCPILGSYFDDTRFGDADFAPSFEVLEEHASCYEMAFILSDDAPATALFIPKQDIDPELLAMCAQYAAPAA